MRVLLLLIFDYNLIVNITRDQELLIPISVSRVLDVFLGGRLQINKANYNYTQNQFELTIFYS